MKNWILKLLLLCALASPSWGQTFYGNAGIWPVLGDGDDAQTTVRAAQTLLAFRGFALKADGRYGEQTREQVREFRKRSGLPNSGSNDNTVIDTSVWEKMIVPLHRGQSGLAVRAAQILLRAKGYKIVVDGHFGTQTESAVRKFQSARGYTSVELGTTEHFTWCDLAGEGAYKGGGS